MKSPHLSALAFAALFPGLLAAGERHMESSDRDLRLQSGTLLWSQGRDGSISRPSPFQENSTTPTTAFCQAISSAREGHADRSRPCDTLEEARAEAYAKVACKVAEDSTREYSSGVEYDPRSKKWYPVEPITGKPDKTDLPSGKNVRETLHYHPNGTKEPSAGDLWSADVPGIVLVGDGQGGVSPDMLRYTGDGTGSAFRLAEGGNGFKEGPAFPLSELCGDRERSSWNRLISELAAQSDRAGQNAVLKAKNPDNPRWSNGNMQACPDGTFSRNGIVRQPEPNEIGAVIDYSARTRAPETGGSGPSTLTIDNTAAKAQLSGMLEGAYQYASGIAAEAGAGAEYQSAVAPVMAQGRAAISSIPDRQTVTVPADSSNR